MGCQKPAVDFIINLWFTCRMSKFHEHVKGRGLAIVAKALGVSPQAVHKWLKKGIPAPRVVEVERVTGIPREELIPALYRAGARRKPSDTRRAA